MNGVSPYLEGLFISFGLMLDCLTCIIDDVRHVEDLRKSLS